MTSCNTSTTGVFPFFFGLTGLLLIGIVAIELAPIAIIAGLVELLAERTSARPRSDHWLRFRPALAGVLIVTCAWVDLQLNAPHYQGYEGLITLGGIALAVLWSALELALLPVGS